MTDDPYLIAGHIRRALRTITDHYEAAGDPPQISDDSDPRQGDQARPPTDLHAIDCRRDTIRHVSFWAQFILDEVQDGKITTKVRGSDLAGMARFIDTWALALAEQHPDDASGHKEACREELTRDARRLKAVAHGTRTRAIQVGPCPEVVIVEDERPDGVVRETFQRCTGTVVARLTERDPDSEDEGLLPRMLTCDMNSDHSWQPWQWVDVGRRIERMAG